VDELRPWMPEYVSRIAVLTMLRRGEVLGLRDVDIDLEAWLDRRLHAAPGRRARRHQDARRRRSVDVGPRVVRHIREQQLAREPNADGYLFPTRAGTPFDAGRLHAPGLQAGGEGRGHP
jgi:integrase